MHRSQDKRTIYELYISYGMSVCHWVKGQIFPALLSEKLHIVSLYQLIVSERRSVIL